jgi:MYXO-CTERM domain-containing protein
MRLMRLVNRMGPACLAFLLSLGMALEMAAPGAAVAQPSRPQAPLSSPALAEAKQLRDQAIKLFSEKKLAEAVPLLERALALREKALGRDHLDVASVVSDLAELSLELGDLARAEPYYLRAIAIVEKKLGGESLSLAPLLINLSVMRREQKQVGSAIQLAQRALAIREKGEGPEHPSVARTLKHLALIHYDAGDPARALSFMERYHAIAEKLLGSENVDITGTLGELSNLHRRLGNFERGVSLMARVVAIYEKARGKDHPELAGPLEGLAAALDDQGSYARAIAVQERSLALRERALGQDHLDVASSLHVLGGIYTRAGSYGRAIQLYQRALAIREKAHGKDHPSVGATLNNIAELYLLTGDYRRAEPLSQRALAIFEQPNGQHELSVGVVLNNLASIYLTKGDFERAASLFQRALAIREKALGKDHPDMAGALGNIAETYLSRGDPAAAEPLFQRALAIREKALGRDHPLTGASVYNLGALYLEKGDRSRAEPLLSRALAIQEKALGKDHSALAQTLSSLAVLRQDAGDHAKAEALFLRTIAVQEKGLGREHPELGISLHNLATLYEAQGRMKETLSAYTRANEIRDKNLALIIASGAEDQKFAYVNTLVWLTYSTVSLSLRTAPGSAAAARLALTVILRRKGRVLDAMADSMVTLRKRLSPSDQELFSKLSGVRVELSRAALRPPSGQEAKERQRDMDRLEEEAQRLEAAISARSAEFRAQTEPVTVEKVAAALPEGTALVELFVYRPFDARAPYNHRFGAPRVAAYVLHRGGAIDAIDLGESARIDEKVKAFRAALRDPKRRDVPRLGRSVDELVLRPIRARMGEARAILLAPDGELNLIPFGALTDEQGRYLVESTSFTYLTSGRDLLRLAARGESRQGDAIFANPDFNRAAVAAVAAVARREEQEPEGESRSASLAGARFPRLPGTASEARAIAAILSRAEVLTDSRATKAALSRLHGPRILHVATHGFFLDDPPLERESSQGRPLDAASKAENAAARVNNPLLQSGLALAGANAQGSARAEGILTALEASGLDLYGTRLVVLSACETGLGDVKNGNGVYGLRRALVIAGAETQVMSLWTIDDQATRDLMITYYKGLEAGGGRGEALRQVQLAMLERPRLAHPYYWASFIVSGDPRTLDGKQVQPSFGRVAPGLRGCGCEVGSPAKGAGSAVGLLLLSALVARRRRMLTP